MRPAARALPLLSLLALSGLAVAQDVPGTEEYTGHGDPSNEEQRLLWLINRARMNPVAEGNRILADYGSPGITTIVDAFLGLRPAEWTRSENQAAWQSYAPQPPLAFHKGLLAGSHHWSLEMRTRDTVAQQFTDATGAFTISGRNGYASRNAAQLLYGFAPDMLTPLASWTVDWGAAIDPTTGRPTSPNRVALINFANFGIFDFVEAGVGVVKRTNPPPGGLGPRVVTLLLATGGIEGVVDIPDAFRRYATGVVYEDKNANGEYDEGEGFSGVRVDVDRSKYYAITSASGGYAVPMDGRLGDVVVTASGLPLKPSMVFRAQSANASTLAFGSEGNVGADFLFTGRGDAPPRTRVSGTLGATSPNAQQVFTVDVPAVDPERPTLGDVSLDIDLSHPDRSGLQIVLRSPNGTDAVLWESSADGRDVVGVFDASLRPVDGLHLFLGEDYAGRWSLIVSDTSGQAGVLSDWGLTVQPAWEGPLYSRRSHLFVSRLTVKDKKKPTADRIRFSADIETGAMLPADAADRATLVLRAAADGREVVRIDLAGGPPAATLAGDLTFNVDPSPRGTSRARIDVDLKGIDLVEPMPRDVRVELVLGDSLLSEDVKLSAKGTFKGKRSRAASGDFHVTRVRSRIKKGVRVTNVRGRYDPAGVPPAPGIAELRVGDGNGLFTGSPFRIEKSFTEWRSPGLVRILRIRPGSRTFSAKLVGDFDVVDADARTHVALWVGKSFGATDIVPAVDGDIVEY